MPPSVAAAARLAAVDRLVRDDAEQPRAKRRAGAEAVEGVVGLHETLLRRIFRILLRAGDDVSRARRERLVARHELRVRVLIAVPAQFHEFSVLQWPALHGVGLHFLYNRTGVRFPPHLPDAARP